MIIGSFNVQDNQVNNSGANAKALSDILKENKVDLAGTQELTVKHVNALKLYLNNYRFHGNYRLGDKMLKIPANENNNILTSNKVKVLYQKTYNLPWVPKKASEFLKSVKNLSLMPRIATVIVFDDGTNKPKCMINTHLDYQVESVQKEQLKYLKSIVASCSEKYPVILTGDFNMETKDKLFRDFSRELEEKYKIKRVEINGTTWYGDKNEKQTIDHIFLSDHWTVKKAGIISSKGISDHDFVYADIEEKGRAR